MMTFPQVVTHMTFMQVVTLDTVQDLLACYL